MSDVVWRNRRRNGGSPVERRTGALTDLEGSSPAESGARAPPASGWRRRERGGSRGNPDPGLTGTAGRWEGRTYTATSYRASSIRIPLRRCTGSDRSAHSTTRDSARTHRGSNWLPVWARNSFSASSGNRPNR